MRLLLLSLTLVSVTAPYALLHTAQTHRVLSQEQTAHDIKKRLGHLVRLLLKHDKTLHPHEIIKLFIYYLELYLTKQHDPQAEDFYKALQLLMHEKDAQILLTTLQEYKSVCILPDYVQHEIESLSNNQSLLLYNHIKKELKRHSIPNRPLDEIAEKAFQQYY